jgi:mannosyltransferase OCH1-like enzyme
LLRPGTSDSDESLSINNAVMNVPVAAHLPSPAGRVWTRPVGAGAAPIPPIIHQTWKTLEIPYDIYERRWVESWTKHHPEWLYVLWTDDRLRELGRACYPQCETMYGPQIPGIFLADFGRYMVLHRFGGLYIDLDYECLKNLEPLLDQREFVTSYTDDETRQELNNAIIASVPGHPLLLRYMTACCQRWLDQTRERPVPEVVEHVGPGPITGPVMMTEITSEYLKEPGHAITVHDARVLCPIDWRKGLSIHRGTLPRETIARVSQDYPDAYAATYWTHVR